MRGRAIFGALVPYGRVWCPGADIDSPVERLTFVIDAAPAGGGVVAMRWETTRVWVPFTVVR
jgi:hypothetical protein